jgi:putative DNA primase/helicase
MASLYPDNLPKEVTSTNNWAMWKRETKDGKPAKVPYQPNGLKAKTNDPKTWSPFNVALTTYLDIGGFDGICWMMPKEPSDIVFIDIDHCVKEGVIAPWALDVVKRFDSYTEKSQSGNGLHILIKGTKPIKRCRRAGSPYEIYDCLRAVYLTGDVTVI